MSNFVKLNLIKSVHFLLTNAYNEVIIKYAKTQPLTGSIEDTAPRQLASTN